MSTTRAVPAGQRCQHAWEDLPGVVWAEHDQVCPKCGAERDLGEPTTLARLEAADTALTWPDVGLAYERGDTP